MEYIRLIGQFLKRQYEKIILCIMLVGLAVAAILMGEKITAVKKEVDLPPQPPPSKSKMLVPLDLGADMAILQQVTNPPPVVLSGDHNLFNPVTWRRKPNGEWLKILKTGADALIITNITPLYTVVAYNHFSGSDGIYVMDLQRNSVKHGQEYSKVGELAKSKLYTIRGIEGAPDNPTRIQLEIPDPQEMVWISKDNPYKRVDGYIADLRYDPESRALNKVRVNETITLDGEPYKVVEITNDLVRVQGVNTQIKTINWNRNP
jgi:hypothetical protein